MWKVHLQAFWTNVTDIFNTRDENAKGRTINLVCNLLAAFYNVFITGIFYTGFLTMYGISITGTGIVTFIPFIANIFSIFSSKILSRFRRRKPVLIASKVFFYAMYILATTIMPQFVTDPDARLTWFIIILFIAYAVYAPFGPGITMWFYQFYPQENERRTRFIVLLQTASSIMSTIILLLSGLLTDAVAGSPHQQSLILGLRYFAFVLVIIEIFIQYRAKDYVPQKDSAPNLLHVFTVPLHHRRFLLCMLMMFAWNYIANLNNGLWNYHLLNHLRFPYTLITAMSAMYTFILLFTSAFWRRLLKRYSWIKTFGLAVLGFVPTEIIAFVLSPETAWLFVIMSILQNILNAGLNLSYANILYMNLPEKDSTSCIAFNTIGCNIFAFLGLISGTWISSLTGDVTIPLLGMNVYSVQFTTLARGLTMLIMGIILVMRWRSFTCPTDIEDVEHEAAVRKSLRAKKRLAHS